MLKRVCWFVFAAATVFILIGCGSSASPAPASTVTLTGTLGTGAISNIAKAATTPAANYTVVAINNSTNKTYTAATGADGSFSLDVPAGTQFQLSLVANGSYAGPTVFSGSGSEVNMVIKPEANLALGSITVDTTSGYAKTDAAPAAVDTTVTAVATDGIPYGAGVDIDGKNVLANVVNRGDMDMDQDGVPNLFDVDEDNDGYRNGIISIPTGTVGASTIVDQVFLASNIWVPHGDVPAGTTHAEYAPEHISMRLMVVPKSGMADQISGVQCVGVPADIADIATVNTGSTGDAIGYPPEHSLWKDYDYNLYKMVTESADSWIIAIAPHTVMSIGDTFTIRVTYTDATYEDFFLTTSYILTDWAWISTYNGGTSLTDSAGTSAAPATTNSSTLTIVYKEPLDEDGNPLEGLTYRVSYGVSTWDDSAGRWLVPTSRETVSDTTDNDDGTRTAAIPGLTAAKTYYVVPIAESEDGQINGEETWFTYTP